MTGTADIKSIAAYLNEAARYFESRPTCGEDMKHWANVLNADNCRKAADMLTAKDETSLLMVLADIRIKSGVGDKPMLTELPDAIAAALAASEAKLEKAREALKPFASLADGYADGRDDDHHVIGAQIALKDWRVITAGDIRRAATALKDIT